MIETSTSKLTTKSTAVTPRWLERQAGMTLVELVMYLAILSMVLTAVYQLRGLLMQSSYVSINTSNALTSAQVALNKIKQEVLRTETEVRIASQAQPSGAPTGSDTNNCIQMKKTVSGVLTPYAILMRWDTSAKGFIAYQLRSNECGAVPTDSNAIKLSEPIFQLVAGESFFSAANVSENSGFKEIDFNYSVQSGAGSYSGGVASATTRLTAYSPTPRECRAVSPDRSWFSSYSGKLIRSMTVAFTLNLEASNDRLRLLGTHNNITVTNYDSIGVMHLFADAGLSVADWLTLLRDVQYTRASGAPDVTENTAPKRISLTLGEGLSYSPAGVPNTHFYIAIKLNSNSTYAQAETLAKRMCYPSFTTDGFLAQGAIAANNSCDTGDHPRLTGHLVTLTTEGEHEFMRNRVLKMVYPQTEPLGTIAFDTNIVAPTSGQFWMGGHYGQKVAGGGSNEYRWTKGFEISKDNGDHNGFAQTNRSALQGDSAGYYYVSLFSNSSTTVGHKLYFDIAGSGSPVRYWNAKSDASTETVEYAVVEFGDNRNAGADNTTNAEETLNSTIRLKKDVTIVPFEFFRACKR